MSISIKLRAVLAGDDMVLTVQGGVVRRPVPCDGVIVEVTDEEIFLPADKVTECLGQLRTLKDERAGDRRAPLKAEQLSLTGGRKRTAS